MVMVNLTIDGQKVSVPQGTTIMQAAATVGIDIPRLCYLKDINEISACKVCVVEIQGQNRVVTACTTPVQEDLVVYTNSPKARSVRRTNVELILSQHDCLCATCVRSGNCSLQKLANDLGIYDIPYERDVVDMPWNQDFPLIRDSKKCIKCMRCVQICDKVQKLHIWDVQNTGSRTTVDVAGNVTIEDSDCSLCGQCITHCPVGALKERNDVPKIYEALADTSKVTVVQVAPAVRTAWAEAFNLTPEQATEGRLVAALKRVGFDYVFDTCYAADVTIMEEGTELLEHLANPQDHSWPMFTSCCPGWVSYVNKKYPYFVPNLSTTKSPQQIFGALTKSFFAQQKGGEGDETGRKVRTFKIGGTVLRTCTVSGLGNAGKLLEDLKAGRVQYDFVEVMACPGGCVGGGGQPIHDGEERAAELGSKLYALDSERPLRQSHLNPDVQALYKEFLEKPLGEKSEALLHSDHVKEHNYQ